MGKIDTVGVYRGEIMDHSLGFTKNSYPQMIVTLRATQKYLEEKHELEHFHEQGVIEKNDDGGFKQQWVYWADFDEYITAYLVLFNNAESYDDESKLLNYDKLCDALGWEGADFAPLGDGTYVGTQILFRIEENEYNGETRLQVNWVDDYDASPDRELRKLDKDELKSMTSKLKTSNAKSSKKSAAKPAKGKPSSKSQEKSGKQTETSSEEPAGETTSEQTAESDSGEGQEAQSEGSSLPAETDSETAWNLVCENQGDNNDTDVEDAWIAAIDEIGGEKDEDDFTPSEWAQVRDHVINALNIKV